MEPLFKYRDYKRYLLDLLETRKGSSRGTRSALAKAAQCQLAYVSQVFNGHAHFTLEQADRINGFCGHAGIEEEFFLLLVQYGRAGTASLRERFLRSMKTLAAERERRLMLRAGAPVDEKLPDRQQSLYFQQWDFAAVHALTTVPGFGSPERIAERLRIPLSRVSEILDFLYAHGLIERGPGGISANYARLHLEPGSPAYVAHTSNWRLHALKSLNRKIPDCGDRHYSSVMTLSRADAQRFREKVNDFILETKRIPPETEPEELYCLLVDFFEI